MAEWLEILIRRHDGHDATLQTILENQEAFMATLADVTAAIDGFKTEVSAELTAIKGSVDNAVALIQGLQGQTSPDLQPVIDQLAGVQSALDTQAQAIKSEVDAAVPAPAPAADVPAP